MKISELTTECQACAEARELRVQLHRAAERYANWVSLESRLHCVQCHDTGIVLTDEGKELLQVLKPFLKD